MAENSQNGREGANKSQSESGPEASVNKPLFAVQSDNVRATVWMNQNSKSGTEFPTVTLSRSWRQANGEWANSYSFRFQDLQAVAAALTTVDEELRQRGLGKDVERVRVIDARQENGREQGRGLGMKR